MWEVYIYIFASKCKFRRTRYIGSPSNKEDFLSEKFAAQAIPKPIDS